jgi:hypothetical protein
MPDIELDLINQQGRERSCRGKGKVAPHLRGVKSTNQEGWVLLKESCAWKRLQRFQ